MTFRAFISVDLSATDGLRSLSSEIATSGASTKLVDLDIIHLTLKFLGDTSEQLVPGITSIMNDSVQGVQPFNIRLKGTGVFPNERYMKVFWVGVEDGGNLAPIAEKIDIGLNKLGFSREDRRFSPHATIARIKSPRGKERLKAILDHHRNELFGEQVIDRIRLKKSVLATSGPTYYTVQEVPF